MTLELARGLDVATRDERAPPQSRLNAKDVSCGQSADDEENEANDT